VVVSLILIAVMTLLAGRAKVGRRLSVHNSDPDGRNGLRLGWNALVMLSMKITVEPIQMESEGHCSFLTPIRLIQQAEGGLSPKLGSVWAVLLSRVIRCRSTIFSSHIK